METDSIRFLDDPTAMGLDPARFMGRRHRERMHGRALLADVVEDLRHYGVKKHSHEPETSARSPRFDATGIDRCTLVIMSQHKCDGTMLMEQSIGDKLVRFECPHCHEHFYPLAEMTGKTITWFAAHPNKEMLSVANTGDVVQNLIKLGQANIPVYDYILFVRQEKIP